MNTNYAPINTLIFDLTGVLFTIDQWKVFKLIGIKDTLTYVLTHGRNPFTASMELAQVIARREPVHEVPLMLYKEYLMPSCITLSLLGKISSIEANTIFKGQIQQQIDEGYLKNKLEIKIMRLLADIMSNPQVRSEIMPPNTSLVELIKTLRAKKQCTFIMLSNLDLDTYTALSKLYPDIFGLFDHIIISAEIGMIKPERDIYEYTLTTYNLDPSTCLFIDDQQENIYGAQKLGINGIVYTNTKALKRQLRDLKLL